MLTLLYLDFVSLKYEVQNNGNKQQFKEETKQSGLFPIAIRLTIDIKIIIACYWTICLMRNSGFR